LFYHEREQRTRSGFYFSYRSFIYDLHNNRIIRIIAADNSLSFRLLFSEDVKYKELERLTNRNEPIQLFVPKCQKITKKTTTIKVSKALKCRVLIFIQEAKEKAFIHSFSYVVILLSNGVFTFTTNLKHYSPCVSRNRGQHTIE
jgi:hypothetical protein